MRALGDTEVRHDLLAQMIEQEGRLCGKAPATGGMDQAAEQAAGQRRLEMIRTRRS